jgi:chorismate mutase
LFAKWDAAGQKSFSGIPDLAKDIRPVLDKMTPEMLILLKDVLPVLSRPGADRLVAQHAGSIKSDVPGFEKAWQIVVEPIAASGNPRHD